MSVLSHKDFQCLFLTLILFTWVGFLRDKGLIWVWRACPRQASHRTIIDRCLVYILNLVTNKCILIN